MIRGYAWVATNSPKYAGAARVMAESSPPNDEEKRTLSRISLWADLIGRSDPGGGAGVKRSNKRFSGFDRSLSGRR